MIFRILNLILLAVCMEGCKFFKRSHLPRAYVLITFVCYNCIVSPQIASINRAFSVRSVGNVFIYGGRKTQHYRSARRVSSFFSGFLKGHDKGFRFSLLDVTAAFQTHRKGFLRGSYC